MEQESQAKNACLVKTTDSEGNPNLCCCYVIDDSGDYLDPCYHPVEACCC